MIRIFVLFLFAVSFGLVVYAQSFGFNSNSSYPNTNFCTGGACRIETMNQSPIVQNDSADTHQTFSPSDRTNSSDHNRGGLNSSGNFTYDFNCQLGNCLPHPAGSYQP